MAYDIQTTSMLIGSILENEIKIIFNPKLQKIYTGDSIKVIDDQKQGVVGQVYKIENLDFASITDETLKTQIAHLNNISSESFSDDFASLHVAKCKIKLSIIGNKWVNWRGNLPSIIDYVDIVSPTEIISHTIGSSPLNPVHLGNFVSYNPVPLNIEAGLLEKTTLIVGDKSKPKANILNIIQEELIQKQAKVLIVDPKGSYTNLTNCKILETGKNFKLSLTDYGLNTLGTLISSQIEANLKVKIENIYLQLSNHAQKISSGFLPLNLLRELLEKEINTPEGQKRFAEINTLRNRLIAIEKLGIFANSPEEIIDIARAFKESNLIVLDISSVPLFWQKIFIRTCIKDISNSDNCAFVFYEDAHKYIDHEITMDLLYKTNNFGLNNIFMTNYEEEIPVEIIKQAENLFLFSTESIENNPRFFNNLRADKTLLTMLLKILPENNVLIHGELSNNYPIMVEIRDSNLNSLKNKHFGSIKKYVSEYGEIIYSYKSPEEMPYQKQTATQTPLIDHKEIPAQEKYAVESFQQNIPEDYAPSTFQQSSYLDKYKSITDEYEEELLSNQIQSDFDSEFELNFDQDDDITIHTQEPVQQSPTKPQQIHIPKEHPAHHIPDDEFMPQYMQQAQQRPQQMHIPKEHPAHHIPDDEFMPQHMQQAQQRPQQMHIPKEHPAHHIPDDEFMPQHIQQAQPQPQQRQQHPQAYSQQSVPLKPESIPDQLKDIPVYAAPSMPQGDMDLQEGDKVVHDRYGVGVINRIIITGDKKLCSIQFQEFGRRLLDPNRGLKKLEG